MDTSEPAAPFLPTLDRARAAGLDLPPGEPERQHRITALVVLGEVLRRRSWEEEAELGGDIYASLKMGEPPIPHIFVEQSHQRIVQVLDTHPCKICFLQPGFSVCRICHGTGWLPAFWQHCSCARGHVRCTTCQGTLTSHRVRVRYFQDRSMVIREVYVPSMLAHVPALFSFEGAFERLIDPRSDPPEGLRCHDLSPRTQETAYRGGGRQTPPDFHGHDFGDTIDKALASLAALGRGGTVMLYELRAYAWPLLWIHYHAHDIVIFTGRDGAPQAHTGAPP